MKYRIVLCLILLVAFTTHGNGFKPEGGFVPNSETAVKIAEAVLLPVYGKEKLESERPFKADLKGGTRIVSGTLYCSDGMGGRTETGCRGGAATVGISKADARIVSMTFGR
jgi:hypothetical protein